MGLLYLYLYPGICLTTKGKARKTLSQGSRRVPVGMMKTEYTEQPKKKACFVASLALDGIAHNCAGISTIVCNTADPPPPPMTNLNFTKVLNANSYDIRLVQI